MAIIKKLTPKNLLNQDKKTFSKKKEVIVHSQDGNEYKIILDVNFRNSEVSNIFTELGIRSDLSKKNNVDFDVMAHLYTLIFRKFTDLYYGENDYILTNENAKDVFINEYTMLGCLLDLGIFEQIFNGFEKDSVEQLFALCNEYMGNMDKMRKVYETSLEEQISNGLDEDYIFDDAELEDISLEDDLENELDE